MLLDGGRSNELAGGEAFPMAPEMVAKDGGISDSNAEEVLVCDSGRLGYAETGGVLTREEIALAEVDISALPSRLEVYCGNLTLEEVLAIVTAKLDDRNTNEALVDNGSRLACRDDSAGPAGLVLEDAESKGKKTDDDSVLGDTKIEELANTRDISRLDEKASAGVLYDDTKLGNDELEGVLIGDDNELGSGGMMADDVGNTINTDVKGVMISDGELAGVVAINGGR